MPVPPPNSVEVFVRDAVGATWCHSCSDLACEAQAVKHARWWARQLRHIGFDGRPLPLCRPLKVVVQRCFDPSSARFRRRARRTKNPA